MGRRGWRCGRGGAGDEGMVTAFVVVFATALVLMAALVLDGGRMLAEHRRVDNLADSAARAGAQAVSDEAVRAGRHDALLDPAEASTLACALLSDAGHGCGGGASVTVTGNEVTVTIDSRVDVWLLGGASRPVHGEGSACVAVGITSATC
jgi:Flp pilus assembly protein TadG